MCKEWKETPEFLSYIDVLVDGKFEEDKKDLSLRFRGSSNQRIIDVKKSLKENKTVLFDLELLTNYAILGIMDIVIRVIPHTVLYGPEGGEIKCQR